MGNRQSEFEQAALPNTGGLLRFARRLTGNTDTAEDLVQESLLLAWRSFHQLQQDTNARAWLFRILLNTWYTWHRKALRVVTPESTHVSNTHDALEISQAIDRLTEEHRTVIMLAIVEGFTCREIAEIIDKPIGTVMSRLARARQALRESLGDRETGDRETTVAAGSREELK